MKSLPSQYARPRFATMPKFLKTALFRGLYCQMHLPGGAVEREHVVVVRRDVEAAADRERIGLLPAPDVRVERWKSTV